MRPAAVLLAALLLGGPLAAGPAAADAPASPPPPDVSEPSPERGPDPNASAADARVLELYPNPTADGDAGEYLLLWLPVRGNWTLWDGHHAAPLPAGAVGRVAVGAEPRAARTLTDAPVSRLADPFPLANGGDRIELRYEGVAVDVAAYERAPESERWLRNGSTSDPVRGDWRPRGYSPREPAGTGSAAVEGFVLPDDPASPVDHLGSPDERLLVAAYTFESRRLAVRLTDAAERGVEARLLVEGGPVGGISGRSASLLDGLADAGVEVRVVTGPAARFAFHHAKYAVADDTAVVLTENWKPSGAGGAENRGWGVAVDDPATADELAGLFASDAGWEDAVRWEAFRANRTFTERDPAAGEYPDRYDPVRATAESVTVLTAPGNAEAALVARIDAADERAYAVVPRTGGVDGRLVRALVRAADRGVETRLLLSGAWYDVEENAALAAALNERADREDLPLSARVAEPRGRYGKVHAKGLVVDDAVVVGSLNWNDHAARENREVLVAVESRTLADHFARVFAADWRGGSALLPLGLLGGFAAALIGALLLARREVTFA